MASASQLPAVLERHAQWKQNPVCFVGDIWPDVVLEPFQEEGLLALAEEGRVSQRSGHGVGKSAEAALAVLWFMSTHFPCKVPITAPSAHQLQDVLWPEIGSWLRRAPKTFSRQFFLKAEQLVLTGAPTEAFAAFRTGSKANPEALQGFHSENLLFVLDEASGIDDIVFEIAEGALSTPGAKVLMTGNPTRNNGYFYDSHHTMRSQFHTMVVPCSDSTRVAPDYIERMKRYGVDSNVYRVRVLGEFPNAEPDALLGLDVVEAAVSRDVERVKGAIVWGVDVARFGDDESTIAKRGQNYLLEPIQARRNLDTLQVAGWVKHEYENTPAHMQPEHIIIDVIGYGAGVVDCLKEDLKEYDVNVAGVNVAERPSNNERFDMYRDELWFDMKDWFEARSNRMPEDSELIGQLTTVKYGFARRSGKLQVEPKKELKKRGLPSPDRADALMHTFAIARSGRKKWKPIEYDNRGIV